MPMLASCLSWLHPTEMRVILMNVAYLSESVYETIEYIGQVFHKHLDPNCIHLLEYLLLSGYISQINDTLIHHVQPCLHSKWSFCFSQRTLRAGLIDTCVSEGPVMTSPEFGASKSQKTCHV